MGSAANTAHREPWNKGKIVGQKAPFRLNAVLYRQPLDHVDFSKMPLQRRIENPGLVAEVLIHETVKVRATEFAANRRHLVPGEIFKPAMQVALEYRSTDRGLPFLQQIHLFLSVMGLTD